MYFCQQQTVQCQCWPGHINVALSREEILMSSSFHHNYWCSSRFNWGLIGRGEKKKIVCCLSLYNLFPELFTNENPSTERVIVCEDFISNSFVFVFVLVYFYAISVLTITKSKKRKNCSNFGFSKKLFVLEYFCIMFQNSSTVECGCNLIYWCTTP